MTSRLINVTPEVINNHLIYGASDSTKQNYIASSRCLNYANGGSIQRPETERVSNIPRVINFKDSVGLFGVENHFVKVNMMLENPILGDYVLNDYTPAFILAAEEEYLGDPYTLPNVGGDVEGQAYVDLLKDNEDDESCGTGTICINTYEPARTGSESIDGLEQFYYKIVLDNLKTGNKYIDCWLDVRLYNKYREEHPYDEMYVKYNEPFYVGFHARNTKRLPYNVDLLIGQALDDEKLPGFLTLKDFDNRYLATKR